MQARLLNACTCSQQRCNWLVLRSVVETQGSYSVVVVDAKNQASIRPVKTGERVGQMWVITDGIKAGEQVVAEGMQKAKEGSIVRPKQFASAGQGE